MKPVSLPALAVLLLSASGALAQEAMPGMDHSRMGHGAAAETSPSSQAYAKASKSMHAAMDVELTGDADLDFLQGMIPHHQGAIDMAKVELEYGKDPKVKDLARKIIAAQEAEIAEMKRWIAERK